MKTLNRLIAESKKEFEKRYAVLGLFSSDIVYRMGEDEQEIKGEDKFNEIQSFLETQMRRAWEEGRKEMFDERKIDLVQFFKDNATAVSEDGEIMFVKIKTKELSQLTEKEKTELKKETE